jgi:hypothetical protein
MWESTETQKAGHMLYYTGGTTGNETKGANWRVEQVERPSVLEISDAYVLPTGVVLANNTYVFDLAPRTCKQRELNPQPGVPLPMPPSDQQGRPCKRAVDGHSLYVTVQWWGRAYYHSFIEQASRLAPFQERIFKDDHTHPFSQVTILRPNIYPSMATYALNLLGLENTTVMQIDQQYEECASASMVLLPTSHGCSRPNAIAIRLFRKQLREVLLHQVIPTATLFTRRPVLVIKRPHGWKRSVTNFYEFLSALRKHLEPQEQVVVHYGTESVRDQALMFYQAKLIVGPHGAGMSNVLFSPDDAKLIDNDLGFVDLASKLGMEHHVIVCAPYINSTYMIKFDIDRIVSVVEQALRNPFIPAPSLESSVES